MKKQAIVFSGQGSQYINMGNQFFKESKIGKKYLKEASSILEYDLEKIIRDDVNKSLKFTEYTQPALLTYSVAQFFDLKNNFNINPIIMAGHSLGEYAALICSGSLSFKDGLNLVSNRGRLMSHSSSKPGSMVAVRNFNLENLKYIVEEARENSKKVCISNINNKSNIVISGYTPHIKEIVRVIERQQGECIYLNVSNAFHSDLMEEANNKFNEYLKSTQFLSPKVEVISNIDGLPYKNEREIQEKLSKQMVECVDWRATCNYINSSSADFIIECGAKNQLKKLYEQEYKEKSLPVFSMDIGEDKLALKDYLNAEGVEIEDLSEYSFVGRVLGIIASTKNNNWDNEEFEKGVITPYKKLQNIAKNELKENDYDSHLKILSELKDILEVKKVPIEEQVSKINFLLKTSKINKYTEELMEDIFKKE